MDNKDKVLFLLEIESEDVFAFFPELKWNDEMYTSYAHIGQHSACHIDYANGCKEASISQYEELANELTRIGYTLQILNKK